VYKIHITGEGKYLCIYNFTASDDLVNGFHIFHKGIIMCMHFIGLLLNGK
jgi:hypothetical protein